MQSTSSETREVTLVQAREQAMRQIDAATRSSARHAVIVLREEDKPAAKARFGTPLVFSVHEAKGLEYPHVVSWGIVSGHRAAYGEVCAGGSSGQAWRRGQAAAFRAADDDRAAPATSAALVALQSLRAISVVPDPAAILTLRMRLEQKVRWWSARPGGRGPT